VEHKAAPSKTANRISHSVEILFGMYSSFKNDKNFFVG
jgi:hypothetical protein